MKPNEQSILVSALGHHKHHQPNVVAVCDEDNCLTFSELWQTSTSLAERLSTQQSNVVANALPSGTKFTVAFLATQLSQGCSISLPSTATVAEATNYLAAVPFQSGLCTADSVWNQLDERFTARVDPTQTTTPGYLDGSSWIQFTSGSTGLPKAILLRQSALNANLRLHTNWLEQWQGRSAFCPMPQFHAMGGAVMQEYLYAGASLSVATKFMPGTDIKRMQEAKTELLIAPPSYLQMLLSLKAITPKKLPNLKAVELGSASVHSSLIEALAKQYPGLTIRIRYGQSEAAGALSTHTFTACSNTPIMNGTIGKPITGISIECDPTTDELRFNAPTCAHLKIENGKPQTVLSEEYPWLQTGDLGQFLHQENTWRVLGRSSTFIKRNGYRINPEDLEAIVNADPSVARSTAIGLPDAMAGEKIIVLIQPTTGDGVPNPTDLLNLCKQMLSSYKWPQKLIFTNELPLTASGKPDRSRAKALAIELQNLDHDEKYQTDKTMGAATHVNNR